MYQIYTTTDDTIILASNATNAIQFADLTELVAARARLTAYLDNLTPDAEIGPDHPLSHMYLIDTAEARALARERGIHVPATTLNHALVADHIPGATKIAGRWHMPRRAYEAWLSSR